MVVDLSVAPVKHQVGRRSTTVLAVSLEKNEIGVGVAG